MLPLLLNSSHLARFTCRPSVFLHTHHLRPGWIPTSGGLMQTAIWPRECHGTKTPKVATQGKSSRTACLETILQAFLTSTLSTVIVFILLLLELRVFLNSLCSLCVCIVWLIKWQLNLLCSHIAQSLLGSFPQKGPNA